MIILGQYFNGLKQRILIRDKENALDINQSKGLEPLQTSKRSGSKQPDIRLRGGTFQPGVTCKRAMMVTFMKRVGELPKV